MSDDKKAPLNTLPFSLCLERQSAMRGYACKLTQSRADAEDVVQNALIKALRSWPTFVPRPDLTIGSAINAWLFEITRCSFINHWRHQNAVRKYENAYWSEQHTVARGASPAARGDLTLHMRGIWGDEPYVHGVDVPTRYRYEPEDTHATCTADELLSSPLADALLQLPERQRRVVLLFRDGLEYREIAAHLDIPIGSVMSALNRARATLTQSLAAHAREEFGITAQWSKPVTKPELAFWGRSAVSARNLLAPCDHMPAWGAWRDRASWFRAIMPTLQVASDILRHSAGEAKGEALRVLITVLTLAQAEGLVYPTRRRTKPVTSPDNAPAAECAL